MNSREHFKKFLVDEISRKSTKTIQEVIYEVNDYLDTPEANEALSKFIVNAEKGKYGEKRHPVKLKGYFKF